MITFERANELLRYEPSSGKLFWKKTTTNRVMVGDEAGSFCKSTGYTNVTIDGRGVHPAQDSNLISYWRI